MRAARSLRQSPPLAGARRPRRGPGRREPLACGRPRLPALEHGHDLRQRTEPIERPRVGHDHREARRQVAATARVAGSLAAQRVRDLPNQRPRTVEQHSPPRTCAPGCHETGPDLLRCLRSDACHLRQPTRLRSLPQTTDRSNVQRLPELPHPLRREAEQTADADELRQRLCLELAQLRELTGLDQLAKTRLDPRPDPGQLPHSPTAHELRHVDGRRPDQIGRPPVGADGVVARSHQVEQRRKRLEPLRQ